MEGTLAILERNFGWVPRKRCMFSSRDYIWSQNVDCSTGGLSLSNLSQGIQCFGRQVSIGPQSKDTNRESTIFPPACKLCKIMWWGLGPLLSRSNLSILLAYFGRYNAHYLLWVWKCKSLNNINFRPCLSWHSIFSGFSFYGTIHTLPHTHTHIPVHTSLARQSPWCIPTNKTYSLTYLQLFLPCLWSRLAKKPFCIEMILKEWHTVNQETGDRSIEIYHVS